MKIIPPKIQGIAMIEILVSLSLIALILLSLLSFQIKMERNSDATDLQAIALTQLENFSEMLKIASSNKMRKKFLSLWNDDNQQLLPQGNGNYTEESSHVCNITLTWFFRKSQTQSIEVVC